MPLIQRHLKTCSTKDLLITFDLYEIAFGERVEDDKYNDSLMAEREIKRRLYLPNTGKYHTDYRRLIAKNGDDLDRYQKVVSHMTGLSLLAHYKKVAYEHAYENTVDLYLERHFLRAELEERLSETEPISQLDISTSENMQAQLAAMDDAELLKLFHLTSKTIPGSLEFFGQRDEIAKRMKKKTASDLSSLTTDELIDHQGDLVTQSMHVKLEFYKRMERNQ